MKIPLGVSRFILFLRVTIRLTLISAATALAIVAIGRGVTNVKVTALVIVPNARLLYASTMNAASDN
jgi:hypothetical protein